MTRREFLIRIGQAGAAAAITQVLPWPDAQELGRTIAPGPNDFLHPSGFWCYWSGWEKEIDRFIWTGHWAAIPSSTIAFGQPLVCHELAAALSAEEINQATFDIRRLAKEQARMKFVEYLDGLAV